MKKILTDIRHLYRHKTTAYIIKRNFDQLIWQLDAVSNSKTEVNNFKIKQPALIAGMTLTHYFPDEFTVDDTSHFISRRGFSYAHLKGILEKLPDDEIKLTLRRVPSFEVAYLLLPAFLLTSAGFLVRNIFTHQVTLVTPLILLCFSAFTIYSTRKILDLLEGLCIDYIKSGKELVI